MIQGETITRSYEVVDSDGNVQDLSGYTVASQIRETIESSTILVSPTVQILVPATDGVIEWSLTAAQSAALNPASGCMYFDVEITSPIGEVTRVIQGRIKLSLEVTR
jgi:hypothetical protein